MLRARGGDDLVLGLGKQRDGLGVWGGGLGWGGGKQSWRPSAKARRGAGCASRWTEQMGMQSETRHRARGGHGAGGDGWSAIRRELVLLERWQSWMGVEEGQNQGKDC
jgi:hypothetical protein